MMTTTNPYYAARKRAAQPRTAAARSFADSAQIEFAKLPRRPRTASPVPHLTSLYHHDEPGNYGKRSYPGNCGGNLIRDLLLFFRPRHVLDPMTGSGTCRDVCRELDIPCWSSDLHQGADACEPGALPHEAFDFCWLHPPYWRQKFYTNDSRDLSQAATLDQFLDRYRLLISNCATSLQPRGRIAILMGDYTDRKHGFVPLVFHTKQLAFELGLRQCTTDIIRFSHGASSSQKAYRSSFIPGLHDVCMIFESSTQHPT